MSLYIQESLFGTTLADILLLPSPRSLYFYWSTLWKYSGLCFQFGVLNIKIRISEDLFHRRFRCFVISRFQKCVIGTWMQTNSALEIILLVPFFCQKCFLSSIHVRNEISLHLFNKKLFSTYLFLNFLDLILILFFNYT